MGNCMSIRHLQHPYLRFEEEEEEEEEVIIYEDYSYDENSSTSSESDSDDDYSSTVSQETYLSNWPLWVSSPNRPF